MDNTPSVSLISGDYFLFGTSPKLACIFKNRKDSITLYSHTNMGNGGSTIIFMSAFQLLGADIIPMDSTEPLSVLIQFSVTATE